MTTTHLVEELELGDDLFSVKVCIDYDARKGWKGDRENPPEPAEVEVTNVEISEIQDENGVVNAGTDRATAFANEFLRLHKAGHYDDIFLEAAYESAGNGDDGDDGPNKDW